MRRILLIAFVTLLVVAPMLAAQDTDNGVSPDNVEKLPLARPIVEYAIAGAALLAALAIGFMPAKRAKEA